ncbi:MAG: 2Fe-2S iron-sulfur cluster-binding protein [Cyanobacteria bacterium P01_A01_bin.40]
MVTYNITLINDSKNFRQTIAVADDEYILGEAVEQGIKIPFECVVGACDTCRGKIISGTVDQAEQIFLSDDQVSEGYILTCVAKPVSDCTIEIELDQYL